MSKRFALPTTPRASRLEWVLWGLAGLGFLVGLYGMYDRFVFGHLNANYGSYVPWGLWVAAYVYFVGMSAGVTLLVSAWYLMRRPLASLGRLGVWLALVTFTTGMFLIWLDLGQLGRVWRLYLRTNFMSMMGLMAWLYLVYGIGLALALWFLWRSRGGEPLVMRWLVYLAVPLAIAFAGGEGALFGVVGARPFWSEGLPQVLFLVTAVLSGGAVLSLAAALFTIGAPGWDEVVAVLRPILMIGIGVTLLMEWAQVSMGLYSAIPARAASLNLMLFGPYWWVFWIVFLGLGLVAPLLLLLFVRPTRLTMGLAGLLVAVGLFGSKLNIIIPGLAVSELQGLERAFTGPGLSFQYFPSVTEWLVFVWVISFSALLFLAGRRLLPSLLGGAEMQDKPELSRVATPAS